MFTVPFMTILFISLIIMDIVIKKSADALVTYMYTCYFTIIIQNIYVGLVYYLNWEINLFIYDLKTMALVLLTGIVFNLIDGKKENKKIDDNELEAQLKS